MEALPTLKQIEELHASYNKACGLLMPLMAQWQRFWYESAKHGVTPEILELVILDRQKRILAGVRHKESLLIRNLVGDEDAIANTLNEGYALLAMKRKIVDVARTKVLAATGRAADFTGISGGKEAQPADNVRPSREVLGKCIEDLRKACGQ